jgi:glycosyltransferase involved in cell wall biosynthesis
MKILQVCPKYYPAMGGIEEHVKNISERLAKEHEVTVFSCDPSGKLPKEETINGVLVKRFNSFSPGDAYHISFEMARELKKFEFDIVHGHNYHALPLYFARNAKAKRLIVTPHYHSHGHTPIRNFFIKLYKPFGRRIFNRADRIIANSNYEKELLLSDFNIRENKISVIYPGINLAEFANLEDVKRGTKTILYVGRLEKYKGVQHIIQTLPLLDKDFGLEIVGKGPYKANLVALVDKLGLNDRVKLSQDLSRQELLKMYRKTGVFVLLSQHEAFSIVVSEALAARTPCIVANTSALVEWIDNKNCFGIDYPINSDKLAELITETADKKVGNVKLWDWDEVVEQVKALYKNLQ